jgi:hypothetical protein
VCRATPVVLKEVTLRGLQLWEHRPSFILGLELPHLLPASDEVVISLNWGGRATLLPRRALFC